MSQIAIMQPYFLPYIGYFQLMNTVDTFVVYDNIQYTKKGWINRNRFLLNETDQYFTIQIKKASDFFTIKERYLVDNFKISNEKQLRKIENAYKKAPFFNEVIPVVSNCFLHQDNRLFNFILHSLIEIKNHLDISTKIVISSTIENNTTDLHGVERVKNICKLLSTDKYINPIGGLDLYNKSDFKKDNIQLNFIQTKLMDYTQFNNPHIPFLSIIDVLMFNGKTKTKALLNDFTLI